MFQPLKVPGQLADVAPSVIITIAVDGILCTALGLAIGMLMSYQIWCISHNTTTIEHYDYSRRKRWAKRNGSKFMYPFDNGWMNNFRATMGETWRDWLSTSKTAGDGLHEQIASQFIRSLEKGEPHWNILEDAAEREKKIEKAV